MMLMLTSAWGNQTKDTYPNSTLTKELVNLKIKYTTSTPQVLFNISIIISILYTVY